ncbi:PREDICTED: uncharacterized protein LOC104778344 [Camelina sativa]|uniref:Uncharacterized protein LOC104778344 n=1 Tax=Camelina sativa TaxID=90675 RepID=A0ABM0YHT2_CAMSA|nr:PREDICTED: uncharacterized protein LOC104778344 [Camelina sativa]
MTTNLMTVTVSKPSEIDCARCECCCMTEEYTAIYIETVRDIYAGKFICGLCSEAVKYEMFRWGNKKERRIGLDEALAVHMKLCGDFVSSPSPKKVDLISVIGEMFRRRLILNLPPSVVASGATTASPRSAAAIEGGEICAAAVIGGGGSCLPALSGGA